MAREADVARAMGKRMGVPHEEHERQMSELREAHKLVEEEMGGRVEEMRQELESTQAAVWAAQEAAEEYRVALERERGEGERLREREIALIDRGEGLWDQLASEETACEVLRTE
ncbi:MAG: hypothetical protein SGPRY_015074, partial [Prymnesium sp.]